MAKDYGRTDEFAPDSGLDSIAYGQDYVLSDGTTMNIQINDWLDIDSSGLPEDQFWGSSHQVADLQTDAILVRAYNPSTDLFELVSISPSWIMNNYRRVPNA